jgi:hypothetical protein
LLFADEETIDLKKLEENYFVFMIYIVCIYIVSADAEE